MSCISKPQSHRTPSFSMMNHLGAYTPGSEKDSSFSDASSGYLSVMDQNDSEGSVRAAGSYPDHSPTTIMNNIHLNQPIPGSPVQSWGLPPSLKMHPQSPMFVLQPMVPNNNFTKSDSSITSKSSSDKHSRRNYVPVLKAYSKTSPHPWSSSSSQGASSADRGIVTRYNRRPHRWHPQPDDKLYSLASPQPRPLTPLQTTASLKTRDDQTELPSFEELPPSQLPDRRPSHGTETTPFIPHQVTFPAVSSCQCENNQDGLSTDNHKVKRFSNTYNILKKSGLLGITLRTKELIRQNRGTQGQLEQLQEETDLFVEALSSGDPLVWTRLQLTLQKDTGSSQGREVQDQAMDTHGILA